MNDATGRKTIFLGDGLTGNMTGQFVGQDNFEGGLCSGKKKEMYKERKQTERARNE